MAKISEIIRPTVFVDMDGVLADFFGSWAKMVGVKTYRDVPPEKVNPTLDKMIGTDFFAKLPKFNTTDKLIQLVINRFGSYNILSSPLRNDHENSKKHKINWINSKLKIKPKQAIIVADKTPYATKDGVPNILIDDRGLNIERWRAAGGFGIKYQADEDSLDVVAKGLDEYKEKYMKDVNERFGMLGINGLAFGGFKRPLKVKKSTPGKLRYPKAKMGYSDGKGYSMNYKYKVRDVYEEDEIYDLYEFVTPQDLKQIEAYADRLFAKVGIDVEFTKHFLDRVNDERNKKPITPAELTRLFKQVYKYHAKPIAQMGPDAEAVMKDMRTDVNVPFALQWDKDNQELDLVSKTVMRKPDFKSSNRDFSVENETLEEKWTKQYKDKINCSNPKGFSQKAHCAGKKKKKESVEEGVGIITPYNTTVDVKPGEVHRQANKLALKVNNQDTPMLHGEVLKDLERRWNNGKNL